MGKSLNTNKEILVNVGSLESRVAILEEGRLAELHLEREPRIVGNIYKARVATVLPGMEAAFVDVSLERHAFLSAEDAVYTVEEDDAEAVKLRPLDRKPLGGISVNQEILVQVNRAAIGSKGARVSTRLALPGRYLVLLLTDPGRVGVSRKVESDKARLRLRQLGEEICPEGFGLIMRTEAEGARRPQLHQDLDFLLELKRRLFERAAATPAPALVHQDLTLVFQVIRDYFNRDVARLLIDSEEVYRSALELVEVAAPRLKKRVALYHDEMAIFERFGIEEEVARLWQRKVWMRVGGYISIDQTEALCAIDVNTARFTGKAKDGLAETILRTNLEAADEIARQLRLRDLGGIIVLDFIDMKSAAHRSKVLKAFQDNIARDRAKTRVLSISSLGMIEMTRKKHGESFLEKVSEVCPQCGGLGRVQDAVTICIRIQRELRRMAKESPAGALAVWASPQVAYLVAGPGGEQARQLSAGLQRPMYVRVRGADARQYELASLEPGAVEERVGVFYAGQQLVCRRLNGDSDVAVSEEGYLIELKQPVKSGAETFTVELLQADPAVGLGRALVAAGESGVVEKPRAVGIRRRAFRARKKKGAAPEQPIAHEPAPPPPPAREQAKPVPEEAAPAAAQPSRKPRHHHRSRRRKEERPQEPGAPGVAAQPAPQSEKPAPRKRASQAPAEVPQATAGPDSVAAAVAPSDAAAARPAKRPRRHHRRRKKAEGSAEAPPSAPSGE